MERKVPRTALKLGERDGTLVAAADALGQAAKQAVPPDQRTAQLIRLAAAAGIRSEGSVHGHVRRALDACGAIRSFPAAAYGVFFGRQRSRNEPGRAGIFRCMMRGLRNALLVLVLSTLAGGCAYGIKTAMFRPPYPPTASVDVYRDKPPDRPYVEIAQIGTLDQGNALGRVVERAKELGADAIILLPRRYTGTDYSDFDATRWVTPYYEVEVIAIKYR